MGTFKLIIIIIFLNLARTISFENYLHSGAFISINIRMNAIISKMAGFNREECMWWESRGMFKMWKKNNAFCSKDNRKE